jgi:hypothetical protein
MPLALLFAILLLLLLQVPREGLRNGTSVSGVDPEQMYTRLTKNEAVEGKANIYNDKYKAFVKSDVLLDMQYFNNATQLLFELS